MEITDEVAGIDERLSKLDLLWLDEQRRTISTLGNEVIALNKEKERKGSDWPTKRAGIRQLDYEVLRIITSS